MVYQIATSNLPGREHKVSQVPRDLVEYTCISIAKIPILPEAICKTSQRIADQKPENQETRDRDFTWSVYSNTWIKHRNIRARLGHRSVARAPTNI